MKKNRKYLLGIVILSIVIKLGIICVNNRIYRDAFLYINMAKYDVAKFIETDKISHLGTLCPTIPPFYILLLTFGEYIGIGAANFAYILAIVLGIFTTLAIYAITKYLFKKEKLALIASFLWTIHPFFLRTDMGIIRDSLYIPLVIYCLFFAMTAIVEQASLPVIKIKTIIYWILFALFAAIANATRREGFELIVIFTIWIFIEMFFIRKEYAKNIINKIIIFSTVFLIWIGISYSFYYFTSNYTKYNWNIISQQAKSFFNAFLNDDVERLKKWEWEK